MLDLDLQDVHVLVTGASGGIGLETAHLFLEQGAKVTAHYNSNRKTVDDLAAEFAPQDNAESRVYAAQADLCSEDDVSRLFSSSVEKLGPIQVVVINHGIWPTKDEPLWTMSYERWKRTIDNNLNSSFLVAREYLRHLERSTDEQKAKASIIFIGSSAGRFGEATHADYASSKSAMMYGLTLSLKNEIVKIAPKARVNCVAPGWVKTPLAEEALKDPLVVYRALATTPLKKVGLPYDVATQVVWLASTKVSGHVSGHIMNVMGGMEGRLLNMPEDLNI